MRGERREARYPGKNSSGAAAAAETSGKAAQGGISITIGVAGGEMAAGECGESVVKSNAILG